LLLAQTGNSNTDNNTSKDMWENINSNYEYLYEIKNSDNQIISLEGKKYGHKNLFIKKIDGTVDNEIYIFYDDLMIKKDNAWTSVNDFEMVDNTFDERYLDTAYIKRLIDDSELMDSETNFDGSKSDHYEFGSLDIEIISESNDLKRIMITEPLYQIILQYRNINHVKDFVVEK
jgi:hypothetical protein